MGFARAYREGDEYDLAPRLRAADLAELRAACGDRDPIEILREGAERSVPSVTIIGNNGFVAGMFGVVPSLTDQTGVVWLLGSDELTKPPLSRQFIRECRSYLKLLEGRHRLLWNRMDERNVVHKRWLTWLGFEFYNRIPEYGPERLPFLEFKKCVNQSR